MMFVLAGMMGGIAYAIARDTDVRVASAAHKTDGYPEGCKDGIIFRCPHVYCTLLRNARKVESVDLKGEK